MSGSMSSAVFICDADNSLTDCLCDIISTHLIVGGIILWLVAAAVMTDIFWPTDGL